MTEKSVLSRAESADLALRRLFAGYGYTRYKVGRFEEYDLYARNRKFLVSDSILTFTDTDGKLMALKPDVTLSIIKNTRPAPGALRKIYYSENVYRTSPESLGFREIMQTGLECIGSLDPAAEAEVLMLACRSLSAVSDKYLLTISHAGILPALLAEAGTDEDTGRRLAGFLGEKNVPEICRLCGELGLPGLSDKLCRLAVLYGTPERVLPALREIAPGEAAEELSDLCRLLDVYGLDDCVRLDFSLVNDMNYYSGLVFRGFVDGVATGVLSGGRYDHLVRKMGLPGEAIGFAVYLDRLERLTPPDEVPDADVLVLYDECTPGEQVIRTAERLRAAGETVRCGKDPAAARCRETCDLRGEGKNG